MILKVNMVDNEVSNILAKIKDIEKFNDVLSAHKPIEEMRDLLDKNVNYRDSKSGIESSLEKIAGYLVAGDLPQNYTIQKVNDAMTRARDAIVKYDKIK